MAPLTSNAHEAVREDGQVDGVELGTHRTGGLGPHRHADVPSLSHLRLTAWLYQDGAGDRDAKGLERPGQTPLQTSDPTSAGQGHPGPGSFGRHLHPHGPPGQVAAHLLLSMIRQGP